LKGKKEYVKENKKQKYSISDKKVSERIQIIENKKLKEKAVNNVSEGKAVLTEVICK